VFDKARLLGSLYGQAPVDHQPTLVHRGPLQTRGNAAHGSLRIDRTKGTAGHGIEMGQDGNGLGRVITVHCLGRGIRTSVSARVRLEGSRC
jgi:hypothetical protein